MSAECEQCDRDVGHRAVKAKLEYGGTHTFCSDSCERAWLVEQVTRHRRYLNRIYVSTRGKARDIAHVALHTSEAP